LEVLVIDPNETTPEERARKRAREFVGLLWHVATFAIVNAFLWGLDIVTGGGVQWAYWVSIAWGIGVAFHIAAYMFDDSGFEEKAYRRFLAKEQDRDTGGRI
jgi:hypothetical protein